MNVGIDSASRDNLALPGDDFGSGANHDINLRLHIRIAGLANGGDTPCLDRDVSLDNPPMIENERVGDDRGIATAPSARERCD